MSLSLNDTNITGSTSGMALNNVSSINGGQIAGFRNKIINGGFQVDQRNAYAAQTITAAAALAYTADRWYAYCTGANVTGQVVAGASQSQKRYQFTGAASVTAIGFGTRLEARDTYDLNNKTVTISADLANSLLTTVTWTLYRATTTEDTFGTLASPTVTSLATGTFTVNSTVTRYNAQVSVPAAATTGLQLVLSVGAQTSGTWTIGDVQLELGSVATTTFEHRHYSTEFKMCEWYYSKGTYSWTLYQVAGNGFITYQPLPSMRTNPTIVNTNVTTVNITGASLVLVGTAPNNYLSPAGTATASAAVVYSGTYTVSAELP